MWASRGKNITQPNTVTMRENSAAKENKGIEDIVQPNHPH